ncbi:ArsR/SmtB family transcription factor [Microbispora sp. CA-102843]|uniref:ArsR/SmtB family transcription factor n=1 Tax=Microbispora sp. CA-102843 TaxID=3239952 RepID=UPI003D8FE572
MPLENPMSCCQTTYSGVAALDSTNTAVTGQAASQIHQVGGAPAGVDEIRLEAVFAVLSEPLRLTIVRKLLLESEAFDHTCGWFGLDRPKSSLTHHFRALREAGVIRQRQYGLERRSHVRVDDLEERFPGLLDGPGRVLTSPLPGSPSCRGPTA